MLRWRERKKPHRASYGGVEDERAARRDGARAFWWSPPEVYEKSIYYSAAMNHGTACGGSGRDQRGREEKRRRAALIPAGDPVGAQRLRRVHVFVSTRHDCRLDLITSGWSWRLCKEHRVSLLMNNIYNDQPSPRTENMTGNTWPLIPESLFSQNHKLIILQRRGRWKSCKSNAAKNTSLVLYVKTSGGRRADKYDSLFTINTWNILLYLTTSPDPVQLLWPVSVYSPQIFQLLSSSSRSPNTRSDTNLSSLSLQVLPPRLTLKWMYGKHISAYHEREGWGTPHPAEKQEAGGLTGVLYFLVWSFGTREFKWYSTQNLSSLWDYKSDFVFLRIKCIIVHLHRQFRGCTK